MEAKITRNILRQMTINTTLLIIVVATSSSLQNTANEANEEFANEFRFRSIYYIILEKYEKLLRSNEKKKKKKNWLFLRWIRGYRMIFSLYS